MNKLELNEMCGLLLVGTLESIRPWTNGKTGEQMHFAEVNVGGLTPQSVRVSPALHQSAVAAGALTAGKAVAMWVQPRTYQGDINLTAVAVQPFLTDAAPAAAGRAA
jgi:hypothetical protein